MSDRLSEREFDFTSEEGFLSVRIAGGHGRPERFLLIGRPYEGRVRVREWDTDSLNTAGEDSDCDPAEILAEIETAYASSQQVLPEIYRIRLWLAGQAS